MKIKYIAGKKTGTEVEVDDVVAKSAIEDGFAEAVVEASVEDVIEKASEQIRNSVKADVEAQLAAHTARIAKGLSKSRPQIVVGDPNSMQDPKAGYRNFGEYAKSVKNWGTNAGVDERLKPLIAKTAGATPTDSGLSDAAGGAAIPVGFSADVIDPVKGSDQLFGYVDSYPVTGRSLTFPVIKHYDFSNSTTSAGLVAAYRTEADVIPISTVVWEKLSLSCKLLNAFVISTEELEEDSPVALGQWLTSEGARQINETVTKNILQTVSGGATPIIGHASVVQSSRDAFNTISYADVVRVYSRFYGDYSKAVWVVHPTAVPALSNISSGQQNMFTPQGIQGFPYNQLMGRPLIISQYASTLGSDGDLMLLDLSKYKAIYKSNGVTSDMSMHLYFQSNQNAYRFSFRWDGKPALTAQITLSDGSTKVSPFSILNRDAVSS